MASGRELRVLHLYPELLNLYGDSGNILVLRRRLEWRGLRCEVEEVHMGERGTHRGHRPRLHRWRLRPRAAHRVRRAAAAAL